MVCIKLGDTTDIRNLGFWERGLDKQKGMDAKWDSRREWEEV